MAQSLASEPLHTEEYLDMGSVWAATFRFLHSLTPLPFAVPWLYKVPFLKT
jgi:hypothetical protein